MKRRLFLVAGLAMLTGGIRSVAGQDATPADLAYDAFRTRAEAELSHPPDDMIVFGPAEQPLFQQIRQAPAEYLPLMTRLIADPGVPVAAKFGSSGAMLDLPLAELAAYLEQILDAAQTQPDLIVVAEAVALNHYCGASFLSPGQVAGWALVDHAHHRAVAPVLLRLWQTPDLPARVRAKGTPLHDVFGVD
jgi:hypothetical protein